MKKFLSLPEIKNKTACGRSFLLQQISAGNFPQPVRLGARKQVWLETEVDAWIDRHAAARVGHVEECAA